MDINATYQEAEKLKDDGKYDEAIEKLEALLAEDGKHVLSHLTLAVLYGRVGQHDKAVSHGQQACELEPSDPFNFTAMSVTYQRAYAGTQDQRFIPMAEEAMEKARVLQMQ